MHHRLTLFALLVGAALPMAAADLSGTWDLTADIADVHTTRVCTLKQDGNKLSGTCKNPTNTVTLTGEVNADAVTWQYDVDYQGTKVTLAYKGTVEGGTAMKGSVETSGVSGTFSAKKQ